MTIIQTDKPLPIRFENDLYPTPVDFCRSALDTLNMNYDFKNILDPGAGLGAWGKATRELIDTDDRFANANLMGVEIDKTVYPDGDYYDQWFVGNYLKWKTKLKFDLIIGNPPYSHAEEFIRKSFALLNPGGSILFLFRLALLESQSRGKGLWKECTPKYVWVSSRRISFTGNRKSDDTAYSLYTWKEDYKEDYFKGRWLDWDYTGDVKYKDIGDLRVYNVIDNYFINPETGEIYYVEDYKSEGA